jgi:hypothetical protein
LTGSSHGTPNAGANARDLQQPSGLIDSSGTPGASVRPATYFFFADFLAGFFAFLAFFAMIRSPKKG